MTPEQVASLLASHYGAFVLTTAEETAFHAKRAELEARCPDDREEVRRLLNVWADAEGIP